jgi:hypothetical protein
VRCDAIRHLKHKRKEYLKATVDNFETNSKIKNIGDLYRGISDFKKGYQPRANVVKNEKDDLFTDCHSNLARWSNHFSQLLNLHDINFVWWTETRAATPTMLELRAFEVEMAIEMLKHKSPRFDQIPTELIKAEFGTIHSEIPKLINSIWNKEKFPEDCKKLITVNLKQKLKKKQIVVIIDAYHFCQLCTILYFLTSCKVYWLASEK